MRLESKRNFIIDYLLIIVGVTLLAISLNVFFEPMEMVIGGVTGLAIIIKRATTGLVDGGIPLYITNIMINIPLFVIAFLRKGTTFGKRSFFATIFLSVALYGTGFISPITGDIMLASIFGGIIGGIGLGMVFMAYSTTGGTDLAASIIQKFFRHISVAQLMLFIDAFIIMLGLFIFGPEKAMYAIISVFIIAKVIDAMLEGVHFSKAAIIISDKYEEISTAIIKEVDRGVTGLNGSGMYTKMSKMVLLCVVSKREIVHLKEVVREIDKNAFIIVSDVKEVLGEGFIEY